MSSTTEFVTSTATLTVHKPPGVSEAVILIASMEAVASITLPAHELRRLATLLATDMEGDQPAAAPSDDPGALDKPEPSL